jgi:energy-coupling factor transporter ATP-binding protein EcfA2
MTLADQCVNGGDIGDHLRCAVPGGKGSGDRIRGAGGAMAAVVMDINVIAAGREKAGETLVAGGVFGQAVIDLHHGRGALPLPARGGRPALRRWGLNGERRKNRSSPIGHGRRGKIKGDDYGPFGAGWRASSSITCPASTRPTAPRRSSKTSTCRSTRTPRSAFSVPNGAGKSTVLRIMAGLDKEFTGEAWLAEGATCGYLPQEPQLDESLNVLGNVMEGVADKKAILDRYNELMMNYSDETADEGAKLQDIIDSQNLWDLDSQVEMAMDALRCPPATPRRQSVRRREAPRRAVPAAAAPARPAAARRADQPPRRRNHRLAGKAPARISRRRDHDHPRPLLPRQCDRLDSRARPRPRHSLRGQLHRLSGSQGQAHGAGGPRGSRPPEIAGARAGVDRVEPEGAPGQVEGAYPRL